MSSRLLFMSAQKGPAQGRIAFHLQVWPNKRQIHTTPKVHKFLGDKIKEITSMMDPKKASQDDKQLTMPVRLSRRLKIGGHELGAGMNLYVPIAANNINKAWKIWGNDMKHGKEYLEIKSGDSARKEISDLIELLVRPSASEAGNGSLLRNKNEVYLKGEHTAAGFRLYTILQQTFSDLAGGKFYKELVDGVADSKSIEATDSPVSHSIADFDLDLRLSSPKVYQDVLDLLCDFSQNENLPTGNTPPLNTSDKNQLAADIAESTIPQIAYLVLVSAGQDRVSVTSKMILTALRPAVYYRDVSTARDIMRISYPELSTAIDPSLATEKAPLKLVISEKKGESSYNDIVEMVMNLIAHGQDPKVIDRSAFPDTPQEDLVYEQIEEMARGMHKKDLPSLDVEAKKWRSMAAERVYRTFVTGNIKEVPSPDKSSKPALQCMESPTSSMIANLFRAHCGAGDVEQASIVYETFLASLQGNRLQKPNDHKLDISGWDSIAECATQTGQPWLIQRVVCDVINDGWGIPKTIFSKYLTVVWESDESSVPKALSELKSAVVDSGNAVTSPEIIGSLVEGFIIASELITTPGAAKKAIDYALSITSLPGAQIGIVEPWTTDYANDVSDECARVVIGALVKIGHIDRAYELIRFWSSDRPYLVNDATITSVILGFGKAGEYREALELYMRLEESAPEQVTLNVLSSVLKVYMLAEDFEEAIAVAKRIRMLAKERKPEEQQLETGDYNALIQAYCKGKQAIESLRVLEDMRADKICATPETYTILIKAMCELRSLEGLKLVIALANVDYNMDPVRTSESNSIGITPPLPLDVGYYNALIEAYGRVGDPQKALQVWEIMRFRGVKPNELTATLLIDTCCWAERVHTDEDMSPEAAYVERKEPSDSVYCGSPLFYLHYLATTLNQLEQSGYKLTIVNHRHIIEALIHAGVIESALNMVIGRYEKKDSLLDSKAWHQKLKGILPEPKSIFGWLFQSSHEEGEKPPLVKTIDLNLEIPLTAKTVETLFGALESLRSSCTTKEDPEPWEAPFVQRATPNLLDRIALQRERLTVFLKEYKSDMLP